MGTIKNRQAIRVTKLSWSIADTRAKSTNINWVFNRSKLDYETPTIVRNEDLPRRWDHGHTRGTEGVRSVPGGPVR